MKCRHHCKLYPAVVTPFPQIFSWWWNQHWIWNLFECLLTGLMGMNKNWLVCCLTGLAHLQISCSLLSFCIKCPRVSSTVQQSRNVLLLFATIWSGIFCEFCSYCNEMQIQATEQDWTHVYQNVTRAIWTCCLVWNRQKFTLNWRTWLSVIVKLTWHTYFALPGSKWKLDLSGSP